MGSRLAPGAAAPWLERLSDAELAAHPILAGALAAHHATDQTSRPSPVPVRTPIRLAGSRWALVAAAATAILALAAAAVASRSPQLSFVLLLCAAIVLWVTAILPEFAVALGLAVAWILVGLATPAETLAGYGTSSWMAAFAILGLAATISNSGLLFRLGLLLVRRMPHSLFGQAATFLVTGIMLTPLLPSSTARAGLTVPLALTATETQRLDERGPEAAMLGMAAYVGSNPLLFIFLNGSTSCLLALGLLPAASRARFDYATWFIAAAPLGVVVGVGTLLVTYLLLRPGAVVTGSHSRLNVQLSLLGPITPREIAMSAILVLTIAAWNVGPAIGVSSTAIGLISLLAAIVTGCFNRQALQSLNWDFLISYGIVLAISAMTTKLGVSQAAADVVRQLVGEGGISPLAFVMAIAGLCLVVRVLLPQDQTLLLLGLALIPTAPVIGVDPWVVTMTLLATFSTWFFPTQSYGYRVAYDASEGRLFTHAQARLVCVGYTAVTLLALALAVPYWQMLGLA